MVRLVRIRRIIRLPVSMMLRLDSIRVKTTLKWLEWMVELVHQTDEMRSGGMLDIVNEPVRNEARASSMRSKYYPKAVEVRRSFGLAE